VGFRLRVPTLGLKAKKREPKNKPLSRLARIRRLPWADGCTLSRLCDQCVRVEAFLAEVFFGIPFDRIHLSYHYVRGLTWTNGAGAEQHARRQCQHRRPAVTAPSAQQCHVDLDLSRLKGSCYPREPRVLSRFGILTALSLLYPPRLTGFVEQGGL
jgi:hypothetical protein